MDEEDEFAKMVGESLAEPDDQPLPPPITQARTYGYEGEDSDDDSDEGEESDEDELGGARLVGRSSGSNTGERAQSLEVQNR